jgi:hypothetical protein
VTEVVLAGKAASRGTGASSHSTTYWLDEAQP